ncbi:MAG: hypothetical protein M1830_003958 [Pleopsidium flavum]|nr:MAG: hypothetical protein M1830_003958 [Pleopsidium flavum]
MSAEAEAQAQAQARMENLTTNFIKHGNSGGTKRAPAKPRPKTLCPILKAAEAPDLDEEPEDPEVLDAVLELPPVVPLALDPPDVAVPLDMPLDMPLELPPIPPAMEVELPLVVPFVPDTAVTVALAAEVTDVATTTRVVLLLFWVAMGAGMPAGPVERKVAADGCDVYADAREVMTDG